MSKIILEGQINPNDVSFEDGGCAVIVEPEWNVQGADDKIFVRIQSWDENLGDNPLYDRSNSKEENAQLGHESIQSLLGKKIRVTIEILEEVSQ